MIFAKSYVFYEFYIFFYVFDVFKTSSKLTRLIF